MSRGLLGLVLMLWLASTAAAQSQSPGGFSRLFKEGGVGATVGWVFPTDSQVDVGTVLGFQFGLAPKPGWGATIGFGWFGADLLLDDADVGNLSVKPFMAGVAYTWVHGRVATWAALNAGVSFNSGEVDPRYRQAFGQAGSVSLDVSNSFCLRPSVEVDYMLNRKFALTSFAGYWWTRVDTTLNTPAGRFDNEWNPSSFTVALGFMVYPFR